MKSYAGMSPDTAEYQLYRLAEVLNDLRAKSEVRAGGKPLNDEARCTRDQAVGFLAALDEVAEAMGLTTKKVYSA